MNDWMSGYIILFKVQRKRHDKRGYDRDHVAMTPKIIPREG
jgi:hypothetical protein